jgi:maleate isomerase
MARRSVASPDRRLFLYAAALCASGCASNNSGGDAPFWREDGAGLKGRIGVLVPHFDFTPETEMAAMAPPGVSVHAARVLWNGPLASFTDPPRIDDAVDMLTAPSARDDRLGVSAILVALATSSYILGQEAIAKVRARLEERSKGVPVIFSADASASALRAVGAKRITLFHPPWFSSHDEGVAWYRANGFDVVAGARMEPHRRFTEVAPQEVYEFVAARASSTADAIVIAGNGLRCIGAIEALEARFDCPVITANQALLWDGLKRIKEAGTVRGYGRIFAV